MAYLAFKYRDHRVSRRREMKICECLLHLTLSGFSFNCHDSIGPMWRFSLCEEKLRKALRLTCASLVAYQSRLWNTRCRFSPARLCGKIFAENARARERERAVEKKSLRPEKKSRSCVKSRNIRYITFTGNKRYSPPPPLPRLIIADRGKRIAADIIPPENSDNFSPSNYKVRREPGRFLSLSLSHPRTIAIRDYNKWRGVLSRAKYIVQIATSPPPPSHVSSGTREIKTAARRVFGHVTR